MQSKRAAALLVRSLPDEEALARLVAEIRPKLTMFATRWGLGRAAAEDVVQETLLAAVAAFREGRFQEKSAPETWVYGILRHKIADYRRATAREARQLVSLTPEGTSDHTVASSHALLAREDPALTLLVEEVLDSLPPRHWLVLMLNQRQSRTTEEIARIVRLSPGRVGAILAEAKRMFRRGISGCEEKSRPRRPRR